VKRLSRGDLWPVTEVNPMRERLGRRRFVTGLVAGGGLTVAAACRPRRGSDVWFDGSARAESVAAENARTGSRSWRSGEVDSFLSAAGTPVAGNELGVFASAQSVIAGEELRLHAAGATSAVDAQIYRMGWYGGTGGRLVWEHLDLRLAPASATVVGVAGDRVAPWPAIAAVTIPPTWRSGFYLVVIAPRGRRDPIRYAPFVVRDDSDGAAVVVQIPFATYQAYNGWGGASLYDFNSPAGRAPAVSFDRPYEGLGGAGFYFYGDYHLVQWLEREGYDVSYTASADTHRSATLPADRRLWLSCFHDEYWTAPMRDHLETWVASGVNVAFLSANNVYWRTRQTLDARTLTCYKEDAAGPRRDPDRMEVTATWRSSLVGRPEHELLGAHYGSYRFPYGVGDAWRVADDSHWLYEGTGLRRGDAIPRLVGYEWDHAPDPTRTGLTLVSDTPMPDGTRHQATVLETPRRGTVVNWSTTYVPRLLTGEGSFPADDRVRRMVANLIHRLS
jgi:hypothetical protein